MNREDIYFNNYWKEVKNKYKSCRIRAVLTKNQDGWQLYSLFILFLDEVITQQPDLIYNDIQLIDRIYPIDEGLNKMEILNEEKKIIIDGIEYVLDQYRFHLEKRFYWKNDLEIEWPFIYNEGDIQGVNHPNDDETLFIKPKLPYFSSIENAIMKWYGLRIDRKNRMGGHNYRLKYIIVMPFYSVKIDKIKINNSNIEIRLQVYNNEYDRYILKYEYGVLNDLYNGEIPIENNTISIPIKSIPETMHIIIFDILSNLLSDRFNHYGSHTTQEEKIEYNIDEINIDYYIQNGENINTEFKQKYPKQDNEFLETISAFSNTSGGIVLFGVDDNGSIIGMEGPINEENIVNIINEKIDPSIEVNVKEIIKEGKRIIAVIVHEGDNKPYYIRGGTAYIRRGSTDKKASRSEIEVFFKNISNSAIFN